MPDEPGEGGGAGRAGGGQDVHHPPVCVERVQRDICAHREPTHLPPVGGGERTPLRLAGDGPSRGAVLPGQLVLRVERLPLLRPAQRVRLRPRVRPERAGDLPVREEHARADLRVAQHAGRARLRGRQQARPGRAPRAPRGRRPRQEALAMRLRRVLGQVQLARGSALPRDRESPGRRGRTRCTWSRRPGSKGPLSHPMTPAVGVGVNEESLPACHKEPSLRSMTGTRRHGSVFFPWSRSQGGEVFLNFCRR